MKRTFQSDFRAFNRYERFKDNNFIFVRFEILTIFNLLKQESVAIQKDIFYNNYEKKHSRLFDSKYSEKSLSAIKNVPIYFKYSRYLKRHGFSDRQYLKTEQICIIELNV